MASIFTVRDKEGNIIEIPALQGPPGEQGDPGPEGPVGPSGIYVGIDEMPEDYYIQIDPDGAVVDIPEPTNEDIGKILTVSGKNTYSLIDINNYVANDITADGATPVSGAAVAAYVAVEIAKITDYSEVSF